MSPITIPRTPSTSSLASSTPLEGPASPQLSSAPAETTKLNGHGQSKPFSFATRAIHVGSEPELSASNAVVPGIELSTTYAQSSVGVHKGFEYSRSSNPTRLALERVVASLEGQADKLLQENLIKANIDPNTFEAGPAALALASGSAATATVLQALAGRGGHVLSVGDVYGGTSRYMLKVAKAIQGVETSFVDLSYDRKREYSESKWEKVKFSQDEEISQRLESAILPETRLIWAETPTNPMLNLIPIQLIAKIAQRHQIPLVIDNTFANPAWQNPLSLGASVVIHSATKYIGGHSDTISGLIVTAEPNLLQQFRFLQNAHGAVPSPFDCWLLLRSIKTLTLRSRQHGLNALAVAKYLQQVGVPSGLVRDVRYPGLKREIETAGERRERELAWDQFSDEAKRWLGKLGYTADSKGGFPAGGMISFHIKSPHEKSQTNSETAEKFLEGLKLFALAESLGGVESLAELPLKMTHAGVAAEHRASLGIDGELVRLSVGIEDRDDLVADVEQSLRAAVQKN